MSGGFSPADLRSAYGLPSEGGEGKTVAISIAFDDPTAEEDLATYRENYGLPECTSKSGCFRKLNRKGQENNYPVADSSWAVETSLDLDMVSAVCPKCHIVLVEADDNSYPSLEAAVEKAAEFSPDAISNSWGSNEFSSEVSLNHYFNHPGIPVLFSSGDGGYGTEYPSASPDVISVGGTRLRKAKETTRGWAESAWSGAGSGCSQYQEKPAWQKDEGCAKRTLTDISAVADPNTPVSIRTESGWALVGGTSVATPILAGVEALSSAGFRAAGPAATVWAGQEGELFDPSEGQTGACGSYLCQGEVGYDGPTGWGTPSGPLSLPVTITEGVTIGSSTEATLHGAVDPRGLASEYRFEYGETTSYGTNVPVPDKSIGSGNGYVAVSQPLKGLKGKTTYHYRITAINSGGTFYGADRTFGTTVPVATTQSADGIGVYHAILHGMVNPEGSATRYYFEYGLTSSYGSKRPMGGIATEAGIEALEASMGISDLTPSTTYHYRVAAQNVAGVTHGEDKTFTTHPAHWAASRLPSPAESSGDLAYDVSCVRVDWCIAVGGDANEKLGREVSLVEHWNGESWSPMSVPNPPGIGEGPDEDHLLGVSCTSESSCFAVGRYRHSGPGLEEFVPIVEHWNGSEWSLSVLALPTGVTGSLEDVSCTSSSACTAVGHFTNASEVAAPLAEHWNGSTWTAQALPPPSGALLGPSNLRLYGVSCSSSTSCTAVGFFWSKAHVHDEPLSERWNGSEWMVEYPPLLPSGETRGTLIGVSCPTATSCVAVGDQEQPGESFETLAESWNGSTWSLQPVPKVSWARGLSMADIDCESPTSCFAVGVYAKPESAIGLRGSLGSRWNGKDWDLVEVADPSFPSENFESLLTGVSCVESSCTAVGRAADSSSESAFADQMIYPPKATTEAVSKLRATSATLHATVNPEGSATSYYFEYGTTSAYGHSVPVEAKDIGSGSKDVALNEALGGLEEGQTYHFRVVASNADGRASGEDEVLTAQSPEWTVRTASRSGALNGISCTSSNVCMAVGGGGGGSLSESLDGKGWTVLETPEPTKATWSELSGVSCVSAAFCMASGNYTASGDDQHVFGEHYDGEKWAVTWMPMPSEAEWGSLAGVSCTSSTTCIGAGTYSLSGKEHPLTERWDGIEWTSLSTPAPTGSENADLRAISCVSVSSCFAVGYYSDSSGGHPLAERFDGKEWSMLSVPRPSEAVNASLVGISCPSSSSCTAVGAYENSSRLLAEHYDGEKWTIQSVPTSSATKIGGLYSVSCASTAECVAVGRMSAEPGGDHSKIIAMGWAGEAWSPQSSDDPSESDEGVAGAMLRGVSCYSSSTCIAVGWRTPSSTGTLVESYKAAAPKATTHSASSIKITQATLNATVNPEGSATSYYFEYGKTTSYGTKIPTSPVAVGSGGSNVAVSQTPTGLAEGTTYHYRVVAESAAGTTSGEDKTLTTLGRTAPLFSSSFGSPGSGNGQFSHPSDVAISPNGSLWVSDLGNNRVEKFSQAGEYLGQLGSKGSGNGQLSIPLAVDADSEGNLWVLDAGNKRIEEFSGGGEYLRSAGSAGTGAGQFSGTGPEGMAIDSHDNVWVADTHGNRIEEFGGNGEYLKSVGSGYLTWPTGIDIGPGDKLWVTERQADRVEKFSQTGEHLGGFGSEGSGNGQFEHPEAVTVDSKGNVWVGDRRNNRVEEFSEAGEYIAQFGTPGSGPGQFSFSSIFGIATDSKGDLWVTDGNNRVQRWLYMYE